MSASSERIPLGSSGIDIARVVFGTDALGGHAWGEFSETEGMAAVGFAADAGVNLFDTADVYGLGQSETRLGRALAGRTDTLVATKFGVRIDAAGRTHYDNSPSWMTAALDASLRRLGRSHVDLYQVHYWDGVRPLRDTFDQLEDLRIDGKIRWYGVSNCTLADIGPGPLPAGLVSCTFEASLVERRWEADFNAFVARGVTGLSWGSLGQGLLTGKYDTRRRPGEGDRRNRDTYPKFHGEALERNLRVVDELRRLQPRYPGKTVGQLAIRWLLDRRPACAAIIGMKSPAQASDNLGALGWTLAAADVQRLDDLSRSPDSP